MSSVIEIKLVTRSKVLMRWYTHGLGPIPGSFFDIAGSFIISGFIGAGAGGTVIGMMAGVVGVFSSQVAWSAKRALNNAGWDWERAKGIWNDSKGEIIRYGEALIRTIVICIKIITAPIRFVMWLKEIGTEVTDKFNKEAACNTSDTPLSTGTGSGVTSPTSASHGIGR